MSDKQSLLGALIHKPSVIILLRLLLAGLFLVSSAGKLIDIERYSVDAVYNFAILPMVLARPFGLILPFLELLCGLGLLLGVLTRLAALGSSLLGLSFFAGKAVILLQGRSIECGCFGAIVDTLASVTIFMDLPVFFLSLCVAAAPLPVRQRMAFGKWLSESWAKKLAPIW